MAQPACYMPLLLCCLSAYTHESPHGVGRVPSDKLMKWKREGHIGLSQYVDTSWKWTAVTLQPHTEVALKETLRAHLPLNRTPRAMHRFTHFVRPLLQMHHASSSAQSYFSHSLTDIAP